VVEAARSAERLVFAQVGQAQLRQVPCGILDEVLEDRLVIISDQNDLFQTLDFGYRLQAVPEYGMTSDIEEGLSRRE
jgi:hypothetical protein